MTEIRALDQTSAVAVLNLTVVDNQQPFVAPNAVTLAQALFEGGCELFAIFDGKDPVGLIAIVDMAHPDADLDDEDDPEGLYVWRLMVDAGHQRQGHGTAALAFIENLARQRGRTYVGLSVVPEEGSAIPFYRKRGYNPTGRMAGIEAWYEKPLKEYS